MCKDCNPYGGYWRMNAGGTGMERCACEDAARAAAAEGRRREGKALPPVLTAQDVTIYVEMLAGGVPYFPAESGARLLIGEELRLMCHDGKDAFEFVQFLSRRWKRWEGIAEMRKAYCASQVPLDAVMDDSASTLYPDGYPQRQLATPERTALASAPSTRMLPAGTDERRKEAPLQGEARRVIEELAGRMPKIPEAHGKQRKEKG